MGGYGVTTHHDVAAYALGVLDEPDGAEFESHLVDCDQCAAELDAFLGVAAVLRHVDTKAVAAQLQRNHSELPRRHEERSRQAYKRARFRARVVVGVAAAVLAPMLALGMVVLLGNNHNSDADATGPDRPHSSPSATGYSPSRGPTASTDPTRRPPGTSPTAGDLPQGPPERFEGTDPTTGAKLAVVLTPKPGRTDIVLELGNVHGPLRCQLVAVARDTSTEVGGSWAVSAAGYGTSEHPNTLVMRADTAILRPDLKRLEVRATKPDGSAQQTLVALRV